jgi:phage gp29-like protein
MQIGSSLTRLIGLIAEVNGWQGRLPKFVFDVNEPEDFALFADAMPKLAAAGLEIPVSYLYEKLKIPLPKDGEAVLKSATTPVVTAPNKSVGLTALSAELPPPQFTPAQMVLEDLAHAIVEHIPLGLSLDDIQEAIFSATNEHDLQVKLSLLLEKDNPQHIELLAKATFAGQVLGFINATEKVI